MTDKWIPISEAASLTNIPERTIRRYIKTHSAYISTRREGRTYLVMAEALPVLEFIRGRYMAGDAVEQVETSLQKQFPRLLTVADERDSNTLTPAEVFIRMSEEIASLRQELAENREQVAAMLIALEQLHQDAEHRDEELRKWLAERLPEPQAKRMGLVARVRGMLARDKGV